MLRPPGRSWFAVAVLRNHHVPQFWIGCLLVAALAVVAPQSVPVIMRDLAANPWRVAWCLPAAFLPLCLDSTLDFMEAGLPTSHRLRRAWALAAAIVGAVVLLLAAAAVTRQEPASAGRGLFLVAAVSLVLATWVSRAVAGVTVFTVILTNWVFGLGDTLQPHSWAVLMTDAGALELALSVALFLAAATTWTARGSRERP